MLGAPSPHLPHIHDKVLRESIGHIQTNDGNPRHGGQPVPAAQVSELAATYFDSLRRLLGKLDPLLVRVELVRAWKTAVFS